MKCCCADIAQSLLRAGADPNIRDSNTLVTPAHDVARAGFLKTLRCLLRHGADVTLTDRWGNTPAHVAAKNGQYHVVRYLSQAMVLTQCTNQYGLTPMDYFKASGLDRRTREWVQKQKGKVPAYFTYRRILCAFYHTDGPWEHPRCACEGAMGSWTAGFKGIGTWTQLVEGDSPKKILD